MCISTKASQWKSSHTPLFVFLFLYIRIYTVYVSEHSISGTGVEFKYELKFMCHRNAFLIQNIKRSAPLHHHNVLKSLFKTVTLEQNESIFPSWPDTELLTLISGVDLKTQLIFTFLWNQLYLPWNGI